MLELSWEGYRRLLGRLRAFWGVLGEAWDRFSRQKDAELMHVILDVIFYRLLSDLGYENRSPNHKKSLNSIGKIIVLSFQAVLT